jgi:hypothetical protein
MEHGKKQMAMLGYAGTRGQIDQRTSCATLLFRRYASVLCRLQYLIYFILVWMRSTKFYAWRAKRNEDVGCPHI